MRNHLSLLIILKQRAGRGELLDPTQPDARGAEPPLPRNAFEAQASGCWRVRSR